MTEGNARMPLFDLPLPELERYIPERDEPAEFDAFWADTFTEALEHPLDARFEPVDALLPGVDVLDVTYAGFGGYPIRAWLLLPAYRPEEPLPCIVRFMGYGSGRGLPNEWTLWPAAGCAQFVMDTRGQGSDGVVGDTGDSGSTGPSVPGFLTRGIDDPRQHYYRRVFTDAVRAVDAARSHPRVDSARVVVAGRSQGGAIALAAAAFCENLLGVLCDVPFLCDVRRAASLTDREPYAEIARYCRTHRDRVDRVFATLAYLDGVNLARRGAAPALFSVGLMDLVCPPSTVYAAYNCYAGPKRMAAYPFNEHEGGEAFHVREQLAFVRGLLESA
jgi:cephalosporin-C deacetylase